MMLDQDAIFVPTRFVVPGGGEPTDDLLAFAYRKGRETAENHTKALHVAIEAGVKIAMGTDIFVSGSLYGQNSREIKHLIDAGLPVLDAIEAATATGPLTLGPQAPKSGQLRTGYDADVIAFDTNPLNDLSIWGDASRVTHIWKAGNLLKTSDKLGSDRPPSAHKR